MRGRYAALSIIALAAGVAGGVFLERLYLNPGDGNASGDQKFSIGSPPWTRTSASPGPASRRWEWI